jgi:hypothetical protein
MVDVFENIGAVNWCWLHTTVNIVCFYEDACPDKLDVAEYARSIGAISVHPSVTSCYPIPYSCCKGGYVLIGHWGIKTTSIDGSLTSTQLQNEFCYNQPIAVYVPGHVFINGSSVYTMDGGLGNNISDINDIYPNKKGYLVES